MPSNDVPKSFKFDDLLDSKQNLIRSQILKKDIQWLCHFTPRSNLELIKKQGLVPRNKVQGCFTVTDENRYDGNPHTTCLSISKPNKWMFEKKQSDGFDLCLLLIDPSVLYQKNCAFYPHNAATASYRGLALEELKGANAMEAMFANSITFQRSGHISQSHLRNSFLHKSITTSDQAEVQCHDSIEPEYIKHIIEKNIPLTYQEVCYFVESHRDNFKELVSTENSSFIHKKHDDETLTVVDIAKDLRRAVDTIDDRNLKKNRDSALFDTDETLHIQSTDEYLNFDEESLESKVKQVNKIIIPTNELTVFIDRVHQLNLGYLIDSIKNRTSNQDPDSKLKVENENLNKKYTELLASKTLTVSEKARITEMMTSFNKNFDATESTIPEYNEPKSEVNTNLTSKPSTSNSSSADGCGSLIFIVIVLLVIFLIF